MITSIRRKFTLWYIGSFMALIVLSFAVSDAIFHMFSLREIDHALLNGARKVEEALPQCISMTEGYESTAFQDCFDHILRTLFPADVVYAQLLRTPASLNAAPTVLATSYAWQQAALATVPNIQKTVLNIQTHVETCEDFTLGFKLRLLTMPLASSFMLQFGIIIGERDYNVSLRSPLSERSHIFVIVFPLMFIIASVLGAIFMKRAFAPIHQLVTLARQISAENLSQRIPLVRSNDEIGELAETFNEMIARLEASFQQIQQFSSDVAHELKTPLTVLKGEIEVALRKARSAEEYREMLADLLETAEELGKMVEDLLLLARIDARRIPVTSESVALDELTLETYESLLVFAEQHQITLNLREIEPITISGDAGLLKRALSNLLANAITYTPEGGSIELGVQATPQNAIFTISDTGIGIPADALPRIFDRFYRVDQSRSHNTGGTGLGLAIVQQIVMAHHGIIDVRSAIGKGTTFRMELPRQT
ncbi:two component sensor histidine kinase [Candidatus Moduliflexus flocculans]|uniref:histidine kinase n=1 Tax=Candidatus Moduliflexus flocculans TaxID=1499966 RepID=A0A081BRE5_9BACT|nr:two component sensor histidine kinase [Candidatus Moduliflexus flocculans]